MKLAILASAFLVAIASASPLEAAPKKCGPCEKLCLAAGQVCVSVPTDKGCKDVCILPTFCGGFAGIACEEKDAICVDDPRDDCDPQNGGFDCGGLCVPKRLLG